MIVQISEGTPVNALSMRVLEYILLYTFINFYSIIYDSQGALRGRRALRGHGVVGSTFQSQPRVLATCRRIIYISTAPRPVRKP